MTEEEKTEEIDEAKQQGYDEGHIDGLSQVDKDDESVKKTWEMILCSTCGQRFGSYLHYCPNCHSPNTSDLYKKYWGKKE